jgi:hypothetical protein
MDRARLKAIADKVAHVGPPEKQPNMVSVNDSEGIKKMMLRFGRSK